jgi:hypothetical protein
MNFCYCISDGKLEVVVPTFVHYLEVLEGSDGDKLPGGASSYHLAFCGELVLIYIR